MDTLSIALKEWRLVIDALLNGKQAILLRKGGILESNNEFELEHRRFMLFPTYVHQNPTHTKEAWRGKIQTRATEPEQVTMDGFAEVAKIYEVPSRAAMDRLFDLHIWDTPLVDMRFSYRPEKPLYLVLLRAYRLAKPVTIANTVEYAGCKSWVPLLEAIDVREATPAMSADEIGAIAGQIEGSIRKG
jgi:hypothetical protein